MNTNRRTTKGAHENKHPGEPPISSSTRSSSVGGTNAHYLPEEGLVIFHYNPFGRKETEQWTKAPAAPTSSRIAKVPADAQYACGTHDTAHYPNSSSSSKPKFQEDGKLFASTPRKRAKVSESDSQSSALLQPSVPALLVGASTSSSTSNDNDWRLHVPKSPQVLPASFPAISRRSPQAVGQSQYAESK